MTATALIVLDVQESFRARPDDWAVVSPPDIVGRSCPGSALYQPKRC